MEDEIYAKLVTIERLLVVLLSDARHSELLIEARDGIHRDYGTRLNEIFPSDPEYPVLAAIVNNFNSVADEIRANQEAGLQE